MRRLERFEYCDDNAIRLIAKVLQRFAPEIKEKFLKDESLQIVFSDEESQKGFTVWFKEPVKSVICINTAQIEKDYPGGDGIIYGIAHEFAHHFAQEGESGLLEKEANDWLRKAGDFDGLINKINDLTPVHEDRGYRIGYKWACKQDDEFLKKYKKYLALWDDKNLSQRQKNDIRDEIQCESNCDRITALNKANEKNHNTKIKEGVSFGIMKRVRELKAKGASWA